VAFFGVANGFFSLPALESFNGSAGVIKRALKNAGVRGTDLEQIQFSTSPEDWRLDVNSKKYFFVPGFKLHGHVLEPVAAPDRQSVDSVTTKKNMHIVFNIHRYVQPDGSYQDTLYEVLPNVSVEACGYYASKDRGDLDMTYSSHAGKFLRAEITAAGSISMASDNHTLITDTYAFPLIVSAASWPFTEPVGACVRDPENMKLYWFGQILQRVKKPNSNKWEIQ
jgi:hypothetical protein